VEREFAGLLNRHAIGAVMGDIDGFAAYYSDMNNSDEAYSVIMEFFDMGEHKFKAHGDGLYEKYMETPALTDLITLYDIHLNTDDTDVASLMSEPDPFFPDADVPTITKWCFCIAVRNYLDKNDIELILEESEKLSEDLEPLQVFAVKVFVPYLSFIISTVEFCMNTTIDDFGIAFLYGALTPPDDDDDENHSDVEDE